MPPRTWRLLPGLATALALVISPPSATTAVAHAGGHGGAGHSGGGHSGGGHSGGGHPGAGGVHHSLGGYHAGGGGLPGPSHPGTPLSPSPAFNPYDLPEARLHRYMQHLLHRDHQMP